MSSPTQRPPSVNALALSIADVGLPHLLLVDAARAAIAAGNPDAARDIAEQKRRSLLRPVINATGVLLHTNLGRAPLAPVELAPDHLMRSNNLEFDMRTGKRGSRHVHASHLLAQLAGAEAALVVNNCAAAVMLVLAALAGEQSETASNNTVGEQSETARQGETARRGVAVSRGELVEIGGGFRVPDVMAQSGAKMIEVGTTNRTRAADYAAAAQNNDLALLLKVHPSNYRISGFTETTEVAELATIGPPVVVDLGSGLIDERCNWIGTRPEWLRNEPGVYQTLAAGAAVVTFSGDKLFGGPQAGIICGQKDLVDKCAKHPLMRALRPGGLVLAALQQTAMAYLRRDGAAIGFWAMASTPVEVLQQRAEKLAQLAGGSKPVGKPVRTEALAGAGSLPDQAIPSAGLELPGDITAELRDYQTPIIARVKEQVTTVDLRTVDPADDEVVAAAISDAYASCAG